LPFISGEGKIPSPDFVPCSPAFGKSLSVTDNDSFAACTVERLELSRLSDGNESLPSDYYEWY